VNNWPSSKATLANLAITRALDDHRLIVLHRAMPSHDYGDVLFSASGDGETGTACVGAAAAARACRARIWSDTISGDDQADHQKCRPQLWISSLVLPLHCSIGDPASSSPDFVPYSGYTQRRTMRARRGQF